jgi:hypothetical protein
MSSANGSAGAPWRRSSSFEDQFFDHVLQTAGVRGPLADDFRRRVEARLAKGAREYGADNYLEPDTDNLREAAEEPLDVLGWIVLELQRLYRDEQEGMPARTAETIRGELVQACIEVVQPWIRIHRARRLVREFRASRAKSPRNLATSEGGETRRTRA